MDFRLVSIATLIAFYGCYFAAGAERNRVQIGAIEQKGLPLYWQKTIANLNPPTTRQNGIVYLKDKKTV